MQKEDQRAEQDEKWDTKPARMSERSPSSDTTHHSLLDIQTQAQEPNEDDSDVHSEPESEDPTSDVDNIFFAGIGSTRPFNEHLPKDWKEAFGGKDKESWCSALNEELQNLIDNDVYEIIPILSGVKPITSKAVFWVRSNSNGKVERFKLQIVARGFTQKKGKDYEDTFAPVSDLESIWIICALAAKYDLELDQMDVATAYLNGKLGEEIYLSPTQGGHQFSKVIAGNSNTHFMG